MPTFDMSETYTGLTSGKRSAIEAPPPPDSDCTKLNRVLSETFF
jgi:hypothetical protein